MANKEYGFSIDDYSACDVFDAINERVDWTKDQFITGVVYDLVEGSVKDETDKSKSQLIRLYKHMLKFQYQPYRQTRSWLNTIRNASKELDNTIGTRKNIENRLTNDIIDSCYEDATIDAATETGLARNDFPKYRPNDWTLENIRNPEYIKKYICDYKYTSDAKKWYEDIYEKEW